MPVPSWPSMILIGLSALFSVIGPVGSQGPGGSQTPKDCSRERLGHGPIPTFSLICDLRTINSEFDKTDFSVIPSVGTVSLSIRCGEEISYESQLLNHSLSHLSELKDLRIRFCKLGKLPSQAFYGLSQMRNLTIRTESEANSDFSLSFPAGILSDLSQLTRLDLSSNQLWTLPERELCSLPSLTHLNVSGNRIQDTRDLGISQTDCSVSVGSLDLSTNELKSINRGALENAKHLRALYLQNNEISQVHDGALKGLSSLRTLDLSGNQIVALPASLYQDCPDLRKLSLNNNRLTVISSRLLNPVTGLVVLDLSNNYLATGCETCITKRSFRGLSRLVVLNLSGNKISTVQPSLFEDLRNLQILDLSQNQIQLIPPDSFHGLNNLHTLKLSSNGIRSIDLGSLDGIYTLNTADFENNSITQIHHQAFANTTLLQDLNLYNNKIQRIPEAVHGMRSLKTIDLGKNLLTRIENTSVNNLPSLIGLKLDRNGISAISPQAFANLTNLQILNLAGNQIVEVKRGVFNQNKKLQAIRLDANRITDMVGLFSDLQSLRWLNISDNQIQKFDYFLLPKSLQWLDIHKNQIEDIGNYFDKEAELNIQTMDISFNRLRTINAKSIPNKVQILSLNDNLITRIDPLTFFAKSHLVRVDLYANQIIKLERGSIRLPPQPANSNSPRPAFYLGGNPFLCDCNLEWLKTINSQDSLTQYPLVKDLESIYCRLIYSRENAYIPLVEAKPTDFLCPYTAHCFALCHCCDFDACDCEMTCPGNCTCYHDQSWSTNIVDCAAAGFREPPTAIPMDATQVYLHGNNFEILSSHSFIGRKNLKVLFLNNSNIEAVLNYTFSGLGRLAELHLEHNSIRSLEGYEFQSLHGLRELYLHQNRISDIGKGTFSQLESLEVLTLDNNRLFVYPGHQAFNRNPYLVELTLSSNPWSCDCDLLIQFNSWLQANPAKVLDSSKIACYLNNSNTIGKYITSDSGPDCNTLARTVTVIETKVLTDYLPLLIVVFSIIVVLVVAIAVLVYYRTELRVWIFGQWGVRLCYTTPNSDLDPDKMYDAYIAYSLKDENFVCQVFSPELEHGDPNYRLCLHYRDFPHNAYVADTIVDAVEASRRTVIVLSKNFIIHEWSRYDIKSALHDVLKTRGKSIILVLGEIPYRDLDPDLRLYLKTNITIHWSDRLFWDKLRFALPMALAPMSRSPTVPVQMCHSIYEVPHFPNHNLHLGLQHKVYEQRTLESQITNKVY